MVQVERLVPCQFSAYQLALCRLIEGEVDASESATASKTVKKINNTLMELRTISNHPLIRFASLAIVKPTNVFIGLISLAATGLSQGWYNASV